MLDVTALCCNAGAVHLIAICNISTLVRVGTMFLLTCIQMRLLYTITTQGMTVILDGATYTPCDVR